MSEVLIVLNLRRRSGVLAAAVAAVHRAGLEFQSQRTVEADGAIQLHLRAEGSVASLDRIVETLGAVSGVNEVADVLVDGVTLVHVPVESEPEIELDIELDIEPTSDLEAVAEETEAVLQDEVFIMPEALMVSEPEPKPEPKPEPEPEPEPKALPKEETVAAPDAESARPAAGSKHEGEGDGDGNSPALTPAMLRRRRRRR